ncbi:hypothetical protein Glove_117g217 [Diversispora epigaea]|uniref:Uncharacterized protein n=1 Tax=Diversispora epigaea TaxID=1348612 RepID=A0A397J097_9GLOM|nr:hypothetical protein Glove_117g217 [Diversispora epigaea]
MLKHRSSYFRKELKNIQSVENKIYLWSLFSDLMLAAANKFGHKESNKLEILLIDTKASCKNNFKKLKIIVKYPSLIFCKPSLPESALNLAAPQICFGSEHSNQPIIIFVDEADHKVHLGYRITSSYRKTKELFSTIISEEHTAEISSWIDLKTIIYSTTNIPYKFKLIICGFAPQTFCNIFHGHGK